MQSRLGVCFDSSFAKWLATFADYQIASRSILRISVFLYDFQTNRKQQQSISDGSMSSIEGSGELHDC